MNRKKGVEWFNDAIIYQVLVDRFAGFKVKKDFYGNEFAGGSIKGVISKLDYIKSLGANRSCV